MMEIPKMRIEYDAFLYLLVQRARGVSLKFFFNSDWPAGKKKAGKRKVMVNLQH